MPKAFKHPLARDAKVWAAKTDDGDRNILVVITTIKLGAKGDSKSSRLAEKLSKAVAEYAQTLDGVHGFMLMNRAKDWGADD